jgi:cupin fold WbuC family metalloprotein
MHPQILSSPDTPVYFLQSSKIKAGIQASRLSPRKRMMVPIQRDDHAPVQRLLNVMQPGSYVQPHRHPRPQAIELVQVLQGSIRVWIFNDAGTVTETQLLRAGQIESLVDIEPDNWHTFTALEPDTVVLEIKGGPYDQKLDKVFATWAPHEEAVGASSYLQQLLNAENRSG